MGQREAQFVVKLRAVFDGLEIAVGFAPVRPAACQAFEHLSGITFPSQNRFPVRPHDWIAVPIPLWDAGLSEILLSQDVDGELRPRFRDVDLVQLEDGRSIRVAYLG